MSGASSLHAEFLGRVGEHILALLHVPVRPAMGCILIVPPFAEEMNKSRRMMSLVARDLAARGFAVAMLDVFGTGDSDGEFEQATWARWVTDVGVVAAWCARKGHPVTGVLGIRLGCALAAAASMHLPASTQRAVFWQPVPEGARVLEQFLRLRVAASMMEQDKKETVKDLRERLRNGETLEVAGYNVSGALAVAMDSIRLAELPLGSADVHWIDIVREEKPPVPPTAKALDALRAQGRTVTYHQVIGEPFWSATEIVCIPELVAKTVDVFSAA